jgi:hypothetical protein
MVDRAEPRLRFTARCSWLTGDGVEAIVDRLVDHVIFAS